ncbi:MAG: hypothetical protein IH598_16365 [Bacteroidales bacterium]|nr:hypothetical protein [Bacteroidales bacterium]
MAHWLEEAERDEIRKKQKTSKESAKIQDKIFNIEQNYISNKEKYEQFIEMVNDLCERANSLPAEKREPWKIIEFKAKESKLNNHLYHASTSEGFDKTVAVKSFPFIKNQHYKHVHSIFFSVSKELGMIEIEVKDDYLAKSRMRSDDSKDTALLVDDGLKRVDIVFKYEMDKLDKDLAFKILDFLVFKSDFKALPFGEEHFKYDKYR